MKITTSLLALLLALPLLAQPDPQDFTTKFFEANDKNGDGVVRKSEAGTNLVSPTFEQYDMNGDGELSRAEVLGVFLALQREQQSRRRLPELPPIP